MCGEWGIKGSPRGLGLEHRGRHGMGDINSHADDMRG